MIKVIKINRKKIVLVILVLAGIVFCAVGFSGVTEKIIGLQEKKTTAASVTVTETDGEGAGPVADAEKHEADAPEPAAVQEGGYRDNTAYFVETRMNRERARGMEMETIREVMASDTADEEVRKAAQERLLELSSIISQEMELENLIRARGYQDVAVFLDNETVTVIVQPGKEMTAGADSTSITELVARATGVPEEGVIVITKE
ncbi:SpoIIIAH-like family protein [Desulfoscipio geothermicus]|uniref:Stage III sporulation protein AH n=1 Tax=Desulfoscipio geothermicus DSM 3669 TaxID=1121426 RepID=A0A1I6DBC7_9FIRM|nr:SpoIIIAH-like family protein [Desulfoscipio geothermicus]SFR02677.1 stage III sporulation protein AH [Desulfoscipio geothermicus DSM 3669]